MFALIKIRKDILKTILILILANKIFFDKKQTLPSIFSN